MISADPDGIATGSGIEKVAFRPLNCLDSLMNDSEDVQRLIRLKRYETPGEAYYQSFMEDFKERQRAELLRGSARGLLLERIGMWFDELGGARRLVPAGAMAATAIGLGLYLVLPQREEAASSTITASTGAAQPAPSAVAADTITLKLPKPAVRVPELADTPSRDVARVLPAAARSGLREL